jgi:hypothetical protein
LPVLQNTRKPSYLQSKVPLYKCKIMKNPEAHIFSIFLIRHVVLSFKSARLWGPQESSRTLIHWNFHLAWLEDWGHMSQLPILMGTVRTLHVMYYWGLQRVGITTSLTVRQQADRDASGCGLGLGSLRHITSHRRKLAEVLHNIALQGDFLKRCMQCVSQLCTVQLSWFNTELPPLTKQCSTLIPVTNSTRQLIICETCESYEQWEIFCEICKTLFTAPILNS